jgi:indole-3-glycerol phosphate synthase
MILDEIAARTKLRVGEAKKKLPLETIRARAEDLGTGAASRAGAAPGALNPVELPFARALRAPGLSFICELKKASPSKGLIAADFPYLEIARDYEAAGAAAVSVLTEPEYFLGSDEYLREIAAAVKIPVLCKDFIVDPYQIYEAKVLGASAVLLICALLDTETLAAYIKTAASLGLSALTEIHSEAEAESALKAGAGIIGINNRDLKTFTVDFAVTGRLRKFLPPGIITVAESGVKSREDIRVLTELNLDAVLVGESLMRAPDKKKYLEKLKSGTAATGRGTAGAGAWGQIWQR